MTTSIKRNHLEVLGTTKIYNSMRIHGTAPTVIAERLHRIGVMMEENQLEIEEIEKQLNSKDRNTYINLFGKRDEYVAKLQHKLKVRERLFAMWERAIGDRPVF